MEIPDANQWMFLDIQQFSLSAAHMDFLADQFRFNQQRIPAPHVLIQLYLDYISVFTSSGMFIFTWMDYKKKKHEKTIGLHAWIIDYIYINDISICHWVRVSCGAVWNSEPHIHFFVYLCESYVHMCSVYIYNIM